MLRHRRTRRQSRLQRVGWVPVISILVGAAGTMALLLGGAPGSSASTGVTIHGSRPGCSVNLVVGQTNASIEVLSGCKGGGYWLSSWTAQSDTYHTSFPQQLYAASGIAPYSVALPQCYYQVDFGHRSSPPGERSMASGPIVSYLGGSTGCQPTTTTSGGGSTTTAVGGGTTSTTSGGGGGTTSTTTGGGTTSTTSGGGGGTTSTTTCSTCTTSTSTGGGGGGTTSTTTGGGGGGGGGSTKSGHGGPPVNSGSTPGQAQPSAAAPASSGSLAFTGFAVLMLVFIACTLIGAGFAIVRAGKPRGAPEAAG